jgi:hypothetical protein
MAKFPHFKLRITTLDSASVPNYDFRILDAVLWWGAVSSCFGFLVSGHVPGPITYFVYIYAASAPSS